MGLQPKIQKSSTLQVKKCASCGQLLTSDQFPKTKAIFYDGFLPHCNQCVGEWLKERDFNWYYVDKLCQWADIPFVPREWEKIKQINNELDAFPTYATIFQSEEYENLGWKEYYEQFKELKNQQIIEDELPEIREEKFRKLKEKWGANYDEESLIYLEDLYSGILKTQNVNGALQTKQAQQLCMISLELESRIRSGQDFDKLLSSYDKLVKVAEFTPKNAKNASDFDSVGELIRWLEKRGWKNKFFDGVKRDIVDETIKNIQSYNQRLYTNESSIGEEITRRIEALKAASDQENYYDTNKEYDLTEFEMEGFEGLFKEDEEFEVENE